MLTDNAARTGIDSAFCNQWKTRYRLTNIELMDPTRSILRLFVGNQMGTVTIALPAMAVLDRHGTIRWLGQGATLAQAQAEIDNVLAEP